MGDGARHARSVEDEGGLVNVLWRFLQHCLESLLALRHPVLSLVRLGLGENVGQYLAGLSLALAAGRWRSVVGRHLTRRTPVGARLGSLVWDLGRHLDWGRGEDSLCGLL